ncbi:type VI secretion system baseplate subunit TssF [Pseudomonas sp. dw_358]|uniref:type VI secretion system baseplate subunit TssF n=1 Tax=Pseudomonas sp. dw_358 TaxID=2720083 RepID=UPI001BD64D36|nr:type VI secretion system baseplate subunit TssF [Pseudomonas sp. dw_358]
MGDDNPTLRYFEAEMRYLREAGKEFGEAYPDRAAYLHMDKAGARDPYIDRLFEGFAFLIGRLRAKLDDDLPELTEGLVSLLWPHYLRAIPSLCIVQLQPDLALMKHAEPVGKGLAVLSRPIGASGTRCQYQTTRDVVLRPLAVTALRVEREADGRSLLCMRFDCGAMADWERIDLRELSLYLDADGPTASALHQALTRKVDAVYARMPDQPVRQPLPAVFSAGGFSTADRLWPSANSAFSGYQLLLEYFTFREKFLFVTLSGLEHITLVPRQTWFELQVVLSEHWPAELKLAADNLRLHAVPVINLFTLEADPLTLVPFQSEYLMRPMRLQDGHTEIFSVDAVSGSKGNQRHEYVPFTGFRHQGAMLRDEAPERYFHTRLKRGANGLHDTWLVLGGEAFDQDQSGKRQCLSLRLTGTNGQLPRRALTSTLLDSLAQASPTGLQVRNLGAPTLPCYPPSRDRFHWRVLSHLGSTYLSMMDNAEVLRGTLALYDWSGSETNRRRLAAILHVRHSLIQRFEKNYVLRGVDIEVTLDSTGFMGEGDIGLFGEMLHQFFNIYADVHLFNRLTLVLQPSGKKLRWNENHSPHTPG